jgi:hypothetical protein
VYTLLIAMTLACGPENSQSAIGSRDNNGVLLPDTQTVNGVLQMRHGADAFARAPQYTIASTPEVVFDGGEQTDFDLTYVFRPVLLSDGRAVATFTRGGGRLMLFKADGTPERVMAQKGWGPGDVMAPCEPTVLAADTIMVFDATHRRVSWFAPDSGILHSEMFDEGLLPLCRLAAGRLANGRFLTMSWGLLAENVDSTHRVPTAVITVDHHFGSPDTVVIVPGTEMTPFETRYRGRRDVRPESVLFGRRLLIAPWDSMIAIANGAGGYVVERRNPSGFLVGRVSVAEPRRIVTPAMVQDEIDRALARFEGPQSEGLVDPAESRRIAREQPVADSLPSYGLLTTAPNGVLWITDFGTYIDSTIAATAFRSDGAILARLTIPRLSPPVWFGADRVMLREVDADGVVRFGIYRMIAGTAGL